MLTIRLLIIIIELMKRSVRRYNLCSKTDECPNNLTTELENYLWRNSEGVKVMMILQDQIKVFFFKICINHIYYYGWRQENLSEKIFIEK
jgi:hypothetical protein